MLMNPQLREEEKKVDCGKLLLLLCNMFITHIHASCHRNLIPLNMKIEHSNWNNKVTWESKINEETYKTNVTNPKTKDKL